MNSLLKQCDLCKYQPKSKKDARKHERSHKEKIVEKELKEKEDSAGEQFIQDTLDRY